MNKIENLKPFPKFCCSIGYIPTSYKVSMSYEEQLWWLCDFLENTVIPTVNQNGQAVEELQNLYVELKSYVDNYFENLDIQEEINNKLDEMAESGELTEIIAQYLQLAGLLCFNTVNDMKNATNLINGSFAKTYGLNQYKDGKGEFYKIRNILNTDVVDNINIIALNNFNNLIAEKIPNYYLNNIQNNINLLTNKKYVFIGDSYLEGYTPDGIIENWGIKLANILGLNNNQYKIVAYGGSGFTRTDNKTFSQMLNELESDNTVTDIIVCGGYNDQGASYTNLLSYMTDFKNISNTKFPNAKISIGHIGWTKNSNTIYTLHVNICNYKKCASKLGLKYLSNVEYTLKDYFRVFSSDGFHPNEDGQNELAMSIASAIISNQANIQLPFKNINFTTNLGNITSKGNLGATVNNNITNLYMESIFTLRLGQNVININSDNTPIEIGDITDGYVVGSSYGTVSLPIVAVVGYAKGYATLFGKLIINNNKLYLSFYSADKINSGTSFNNITGVYLLQIMGSNSSVDSSLS